MPFFNYAAHEVTCRLVYYGPGLGGKTTNVKHILGRTRPEMRGKLVSLDTDSERTLFFDFLPISLGTINGLTIRLHLYTVPGQMFYAATRKLILRSADGVVLVADSQVERMEANHESVECLRSNLETHGLSHIPVVLQCNKQDHEGVPRVAELQRELGLDDLEAFGAVAVDGVGVFETLRALTKQVVIQLKGSRAS